MQVKRKGKYWLLGKWNTGKEKRKVNKEGNERKKRETAGRKEGKIMVER